MDKPKTTPKDFFLWAGAMITLYTSVFAFITLLFNYINYVFPDPLSYQPYPYSGGIPYQMSSLIVLVPVFLIIMRLIRRSIAADPSRNDIWVRRWALFLTLFAAGATIVIDLIVLLNTFLSGEELTARFLLKVLIVLLVAGAGFLHFLADLRGYWAANPSRAQMVGWGAGALVLCSIVAGFFIVGTPQQARLMRFDDQKVNDLSILQSQVVNYWQLKQKLPASLADLQDPLGYASIPVDPQTGDAYKYKVTGPLSFQLCATFNAEGGMQNGAARVTKPIGPYGENGITDTWQHGAGEKCFDRAIDPERYPPIKR